MGRGDKRTRKGKIAKGSFGNSRPHKSKKKAVIPSAKKAAAKPAAAKKAPAKKKAAKDKAAE